MQPHHALYEAEQEEGEGEARTFQILQILPEKHEARGEQIISEQRAGNSQ
jgi:hypothetical protein